MLSVVIPTYNRYPYLRKALASLSAQTLASSEFEVLIIDDGSTDQTNQLKGVADFGFKLKYFFQDHQGVSVARNRGIKEAQGNVIVFFDDDALAEKDWLKNIKEIMAGENIITGRVKPIKDNIWQYFAPHYNQGDKPRQSPVLLEGNCAIKKEVFADIGPFDENLDYGHEGEEFITRAGKKYRIMYYPQAVIYHDYADGPGKYFAKQKKFGEKMSYLKIGEIKGVLHLLFNHAKIKNQGKAEHYYPPVTPKFIDKIKIKIIAVIGNWFHLLGAIKGYRKYHK